MKNKTILKIILFISTIALASAYFIEYILGYKPCNLCLIERWPYLIALIFIITNLIINKLEKIILIALAIIFAAATILSFYHVGIEQGFFDESLVCISNDGINSLNKEDILKELQKEVVSCKNVEFQILGLSLATINFLLSFVIFILIFKVIKYEKNKQI